MSKCTSHSIVAVEDVASASQSLQHFLIVVNLRNSTDWDDRITATFLDLQTRAQPIRHQVIRLLNDLLSGHRSAMREMGPEFVTGLIDVVSGEKDPRNLMIVFSILRAVIMEWDISNHAEVCLLVPIYRSYHDQLLDRRYSIRSSVTFQSHSGHLLMTHMESLRRISKTAFENA